MPKYDVTFVVEYVLEVEAESTPLADAAARVELKAMDLGGDFWIRKVLQTDPPLSMQSRIDAGDNIPDQPTAAEIVELPRAPRPVDCSTETLQPVSG